MSDGKPAKRSRGGERMKEIIPVLERRHRRISVETVLDGLSGPSTVLEKAGISPAALELGMKVKWARLRNNLTQVQLAEQAGLTQPVVSDIESGKGKGGPNYATLKKLADALHVDLFPIDSPDQSEGVELRMAMPDKDSSTMDSEMQESAAASELSAAGALLRGIYDRDAFEAVRTYLEGRHERALVLDVHRPSRIVSIAAHESVALPVAEATTLIFHSCHAFSPGQLDQVQLIHGSQGDTFATINSNGVLDLHNHGGKAAIVIAVSPQEFLNE